MTWNTSLNTEWGEEIVFISGIGQELLYLFLIGIMYQSVLVIVEFGLVRKVVAAVFKTNLRAFSNNVLDDDARIEEERVYSMVQTSN
jgi:predicted subunit of tRNA(5-methylaminomethyl-2-thiouridylate) methyltransferase